MVIFEPSADLKLGYALRLGLSMCKKWLLIRFKSHKYKSEMVYNPLMVTHVFDKPCSLGCVILEKCVTWACEERLIFPDVTIIYISRTGFFVSHFRNEWKISLIAIEMKWTLNKLNNFDDKTTSRDWKMSEKPSAISFVSS